MGITIDSFCLQRTRLVVQWRNLVVTFSVESFSSILQIKSFLLQCSELAQLKLDTNLHYLTASDDLVRSKFEKPWLMRVQLFTIAVAGITARKRSYNLTSGFGFPLTWTMKDAVESTISSEFLNLTRQTGLFELSLSVLSAGVTDQETKRKQIKV